MAELTQQEMFDRVAAHLYRADDAMTEQEMSNKRDYNDRELMDLYESSAALVRKDRQGGGRVDSWARINGIMHVGISGDPSKWSAEGLRLYWEHVDGRPCGVEVSQ